MIQRTPRSNSTYRIMGSPKHQKETENGRPCEKEEDGSNRDHDQEPHMLHLMRAFVESRDPSSKDIDELTLGRFLRARDMNVEKGGGLLLKSLKWRRQFIPKGYISDSEIQNQIAHNKVFLQGYDRKGCPVLVVFGRNHFQNKEPGGLDEFRRFVAYALDKICASMPAGEKFMGILDLQGWGFSNSDIRGYLAALSILQDCYPERLRKAFIVHAPRIFMAVWKVVYPFIDTRTREKIAFVENSMLKATLLEEIEESQIPDIYGGKLPLVPIHQT
ncbi:hypothetical protein Ancab_025979 [Ancistrocladus abbreviatus]